MSDWVAVDWSKTKVYWQHCTVTVTCPCGGNVVVDAEYVDNVCGCGRNYRLAYSMQVQLPEKGGER